MSQKDIAHVPKRVYHTHDEFLQQYAEQTYFPHTVADTAAALDPTTRALRPYVVPGHRGKLLDFRGSAGFYHDRALKRDGHGHPTAPRFTHSNLYEKLQLSHKLRNEERCNGPNTAYAKRLRAVLANWD